MSSLTTTTAPAERLRLQLQDAPDRIAFVFARLSLRYGQRLAAMYEGLDERLVMEDWRDQLEGYTDDALLWGLAHLPDDFPPNAGQFRRLCNQRPDSGARQRRLGLEAAPMPQSLRQLVGQFRAGGSKDKDGAPPKVRWARRFVAQWSAPGAAPTLLERDFLDRAREILRWWEEKHADQHLPQQKAEVAAAVQRHQAGEQKP